MLYSRCWTLADRQLMGSRAPQSDDDRKEVHVLVTGFGAGTPYHQGFALF